MATAEEILSQQAEAYQNAPRFNRWQPPLGDYIETIEDVTTGFFFGKNAGVQILGRIQEGDHQDKINVLGIFTDKNHGMLADAVDIMGGESQHDPLVAATFLKTKIGTPVQVRVESRKDKNGVERINANIIGLIPESIAQDSAPEEVAEEAAPEEA